MPEKALATKPENVKEDQTVVERIDALQPRPAQPFISAATGQAETSTVTKRTFFLQWLFTNIVGWAVGFGVSFGLGEAVGYAVAGVAQWYMLRRYISQAHWWIVASAVGGAVGWAVGYGLGEAVDGAVGQVVGYDGLGGAVGYGLGWAVGGVIGGAIYAISTVVPLLGVLQGLASHQTTDEEINHTR